jgi:hypothetical protein
MEDENFKQYYPYVVARLNGMADAVVAGNVAELDKQYDSANTKYWQFLKSYGKTLESEFINYRDVQKPGEEYREGMTFLQLAVLSSNPKMVEHFFTLKLVSANKADATKIYIDYKKPPTVSENPTAHIFDGKTARGMAQKLYDESIKANVPNKNYETIYLFLESQGAKKRNTAGKIARAVGTGALNAVKGVVGVPVALLKAGIGFGGKRRTRKRRVAKMRKARKTRSRR